MHIIYCFLSLFGKKFLLSTTSLQKDPSPQRPPFCVQSILYAGKFSHNSNNLYNNTRYLFFVATPVLVIKLRWTQIISGTVKELVVEQDKGPEGSPKDIKVSFTLEQCEELCLNRTDCWFAVFSSGQYCSLYDNQAAVITTGGSFTGYILLSKVFRITPGIAFNSILCKLLPEGVNNKYLTIMRCA